jgi:2-methylcitrate dehydratase PrpD
VKVTQRLARFIAEHRYSDLAPEVRQMARYTIADTMGCCIGGYTVACEECSWIINLVKDLKGRPEATVFMDGFRTSAPLAALANGTMIHTIDFDDTHLGSISHLSASLVPTVFSLAQRLNADGSGVLEAFVVGFEVAARVGRSMMPSHYKYWHPTSTFGSLASAAAAAKLLKLDPLQTEYSLGLAADMAGGLRYCIDKGDFSKSLHPGFAAMRGVMLALLVQKGAHGPAGILEYPTGFCNAFSQDSEIQKITEGLGETYEISSNSLKAYPTILCSHSSIQAVLEMMREHSLDESEIVKIRLRISETAKGQGQNYHPDNPLAARLSIPYCVSLAVIDKKVGLTQFTREKLGDPQIREFIKRIEIKEDPSLNQLYPETLASIVEMEIKDKGTLRHQVIYPKGNTRNPLTESDIADKFMELSSSSLGKARSEELLEMLFHLDQLNSVERLVGLIRAVDKGPWYKVQG